MKLRLSPRALWRIAKAWDTFAGHFLLLAPATTKGYLQAKIDVAHGRHKFLYSGVCPEWHVEAEIQLLTKYEIEYVNLDSSERYAWIADYKRTYNKVALEAIRQKFGIDVVDICLKAAESSYRAGIRYKTAQMDLMTLKIPA